MSTINPIHTTCKNCVFAKYEDITQIDCHLDYISLYKTKNIEILEAYDDDKEFYIINNKKCIGYRENSWFEKKQLNHLSIEEKINKYKESNYLHYLLVIDLKKITDNDVKELTTILHNLTIKPSKIIFIRYQQDDKKLPYNLIKEIIENAGLKCKWRVQTMLFDKKYEDILHEVVNLNKKYRFILSTTSINNDINNIVNHANSIVYEEMDRFIAIRNSDKSAILFSAPNYRHSLLIEKTDILQDNSTHIII